MQHDRHARHTLLRIALALAATCSLVWTTSWAQPAAEPPSDLAENEIWFGAYSEPVDLQVLIDFISKELEINILVSDTGLQGQQIIFRAPMRVQREQLLVLLELFLEQKGYTLTKDAEEGWYIVRPGGDLPINLNDDAMATTQVFVTPLARPTAIKQAIDTTIGATAAGQARMAPIDELGVIISTAPPRVNRAIEQVIELILSGAKGQTLHRFDLIHIAAGEARDRILELIGQATTSRTTRGGQAGGGAAPGGSLHNLGERLLADRQGNSLIFRGVQTEADEVRELTNMVDAPSRLIIRRYAATPYVAQLGERLGLGPVVQGAGGGSRRSGAASAAAGGELVGSGFLMDTGDELAFTYFGTPEQHRRVDELVEEFAPQTRDQRIIVEFYKLKHTDAIEVADLLSSLLDIDQPQVAESPFLPQSLDVTPRGLSRIDTLPAQPQPADIAPPPTGGAEDFTGITPTEGIAIIADESNNRLIIRAPARQQAEFAQIISKLDERKPQVYIEVQIISVSDSNDFSFDIDIALNADSDTMFQGLSQLAEASFVNGLTSAIVDTDNVDAIIQTMISDGSGRVISRPRVLVNDNEDAEVTNTREEPFATTTQTAGAPSQTGLGGTLSAGTTFTVRPHIGDYGFLVLEFSVDLSSFGERPNPDLPPVRLADRVTSTVTIPSDSTVVVGGLSFSSYNETVSKVPILGDIPIIGLAFQNISQEESRSRIYVFITPRVLRDPAFADLRLITEGPMDETGADPDTPRLVPAAMPISGAISYDDLNEEEEDNAANFDDQADMDLEQYDENLSAPAQEKQDETEGSLEEAEDMSYVPDFDGGL